MKHFEQIINFYLITYIYFKLFFILYKYKLYIYFEKVNNPSNRKRLISINAFSWRINLIEK